MTDLPLFSQVSRESRRDAVILVLLTVLAGALRFARLNTPNLLPDDAFTFWRICGSYGEMIETLRDDGFPPLHYTLLWWLKSGCPLGLGGLRLIPGGWYPSPPMLRFVPAVCGTLMPAAMYFLGRQLFTRRASLIAALISATSAYLLWFSRDIKMYMPLWLLTTLSVASLLWWLRTSDWTAWLCWIAASCAAVGVHSIGAMVIALTPLIVLTHRRGLRLHAVALMLVGLIVIATGPGLYYLGFNQWTAKSGGVLPGAMHTPAAKDPIDWERSGLGWLHQTPDEPGVVVETVSTWLTCFEWSMRSGGVPDRPIEKVTVYGAGATLLFMGMGVLPWGFGKREGEKLSGEPLGEDAWRIVLWLGTWVLLIGYGFFFCRSVREPEWPLSYFFPSGLVQVSVGLIGASVGLLAWRRRLGAGLIVMGQCLLAGGAIVGMCTAAWWGMNAVRAAALAKDPSLPWETLWHTRYVAIVWPAVAMIVAALLDRVPTWPLRAIGVAVFVAANLTNGIMRIACDSQYRFDLVWRDVWADRAGSDTRTFVNIGFGGGGPLPNIPYWRMVPAYYGVTTGRVETSPPDFRVGKTWPFVYGPVFDRIAEQINIRSDNLLAAVNRTVRDDGAAVKRVIVWNSGVGGEPMEIEGFRLVHDNQYDAYWAWSWRRQGTLMRREYVRE